MAIERVRLPHDPPTRCERFQRAGETTNAAAGERFWYADRVTVAQVVDLGLGVGLVDWWLFDDLALLALHFDGAGRWLHSTVTTDSDLVGRAAKAWQIARSLATEAPAWEATDAS